MAGLAKPNVDGLGEEVTHELIYSYVKNSAEGLFDGICVNEWDTERVCYWNDTTTYITIRIDGDCNIWRSGTSSWSNYSHPFIIHKENKDGQFIDITDEIVQKKENVTETQWSKFISNLKAGTYKFIATGLRIDSEWYLESIAQKTSGTPLSINKTLKENLPTLVEPNKDEIHFTEDGGIYINDKDGKLIRCNTGDVVKEVSNPLTTTYLEYGEFALSDYKYPEKLENTIIEFDKTINSNIELSNGTIKLRKDKVYHINVNFVGKSSGNSGAKIKLRNITDNVDIKNLTFTSVANTTNTIPQSTMSTILQTTEDMEIALVTGDTYLTEVGIGTNMIVQEIRNNPVNQYGGFQTEILFDGNANTIEEYMLTNDVNNFDFIIPTYKVKGDYDSIPSVIPKMTSNTEPSPFVAKASSEAQPAFGAFNQVTGVREQVWYSETGFPHWVSITNNESPMTVNAFEITNGTEPSGYSKFAPKTFTFEGSNDGETYDVIKEFTIPNLASGAKTTLFLDKDVSYKSYKLNITDGYYVDNHAGVVIGELKLFYVNDTIDSSIIPVSSMGSIIKKVISNENMSILFNKDKLEVLSVNGMSINKIIGIKGQLPSLLVGGEF